MLAKIIYAHFRRLGLLVVLFLVLQPGSPAAREVRVGTWKTAQTIQPFYYENVTPPGLKPTVYSFTNPADQKVALLAGSLEMCGTTLAHAMHASSKGEPVVLVSALCNKCSALVVRKDGPIRTEKDLAGKRIGYVPGTMHEILLRETLTRAGISPDRDTRLTRVDFFDMGTALARGNIDAFLSGEPFPATAVAQGYGRILSYPYYGEAIGTLNAGMLVREETIRKDPRLVYDLVLAHARATRYLQDHPDVWLKRAAAFGTPLAVLQKAAPNMELAWDMDRAYTRRARELGKRMEALGVITAPPDYDRLFDLSFLQRVRRSGLLDGPSKGP